MSQAAVKQSIVDVFIWFAPDDRPEYVPEMISKLGSMAGVVSASINPKLKRFLDISYDPYQVSSKQILECVRDTGYTATLVGL